MGHAPPLAAPLDQRFASLEDSSWGLTWDSMVVRELGEGSVMVPLVLSFQDRLDTLEESSPVVNSRKDQDRQFLVFGVDRMSAEPWDSLTVDSA